MKTYKNLWNDFISDENIKLAIKNSSKGGKKKKRNDVKAVLKDVDKSIQDIREYMNNYYNDDHKPKIIYDGISKKKRTIIVPTYRELIVQHMLIQVLKPILLKGTYEHAYGSIPKRGVHKAKKAIVKWIRTDGKNCKYCLKIDIRKYFESISHDILKHKLAKYIKDEKIIKILFTIIDSTEKGLPLGFYTSQWLSMWFLKDFDHFVKEHIHAKHYMRYMDDIVIFDSNKRKLWNIYTNVLRFLAREKLSLNNRRQLFRFSYIEKGKEKGRSLDFMGFVFHRNRTAIRRSIYYKMCRKAKKIYKKEKPSIHELRQMMSYLGWIKSADVYQSYLLSIKPYFNFQKAKRRISANDSKRKEGDPLCGKQLKTAVI